MAWENLPSTNTPLNAQNLNDMQTELNEKFNYSSNETIVGTWIDGKPIYRKVINITSLPNNTTDLVAHGISDLYQVITIKPKWYDTSDGWYTSNRIDSNTAKVTFRATTDYLKIEGIGANWSTRTNSCTVIMEYTKATD